MMTHKNRPAHGSRSGMRFVDQAHRVAYRLAFPLVIRWWRFRKNHQGVMMAIRFNGLVLAVRHSYKPGWRLPGGSIKHGEDHRIAAIRELHEEVGITVSLRLVCSFDSTYGSDHLYEGLVEMMPRLQIDHREIIEAKFLPATSIHISDPYVAAYLAGTV